MYQRPVDLGTTLLTIITNLTIMDLNVRAVLHGRMLADPVFIIDNDEDHDEVVRSAAQHGSGDESLFRNALGHLNKNQVII